MNDNYPPGVTEADIDRQFGGDEEVEESDEDEYEPEEDDEQICTRSPGEMLAVGIMFAVIIVLCIAFPHGF